MHVPGRMGPTRGRESNGGPEPSTTCRTASYGQWPPRRDRLVRPVRAQAHDTATIGSRRAAGALSGTAGCLGATGAIGWYVVPSAGRGSASPLFGQ
jgi:hypothetical protein